MIKITDDTAFIGMDRALLKCKKGIRRGLVEVGPEIVKEVVRLIKSPPKTGRLYLIGGREHQASAPGEAPADLSGELAEGVRSQVSSHTQLVIADTAPHGGYMEFGTDKIAPRPHLKRAAISKAREVEQAITLGAEREFKKR